MTGSQPDPPAAATAEASLREHLAWQLAGGYARTGLREAVGGLSAEDCGRVPPGAAHSIWQIVAHVETCLHDLLEYTRTPGHESPGFPDGLWPKDPAPPSEIAIGDALDAIERHTDAFIQMIHDPKKSLTEPLSHIDGRTLLRQVLIAIDHDAYHAGQVTLTKAVLKTASGDG